MVQVDSIRLKIEPGLVGLNVDRFDTHSMTRAGERDIRIHYSVKPNEIGVNSITHHPDDGTTIEVSAKCLLENYPQLIQKNTIERVVDALNATGLVEMDNDTALNAVILRADVTRDIRLDYPLKEYLAALKLMQSNDRYVIDEYDGSIIFRSKAKRVSERMTFYSKQNELLKPRNRQLVETVPGLYKSFDSILRIEQNCRSYEALRRSSGIKAGAVTVRDMLYSIEQPNLKLFRKLKRHTPTQELFDRSASLEMPFYKKEKRFGREYIIRICNYDMAVIRNYLRQELAAKNISRYVREYRELLHEMQKADNVELHHMNIERLNEIELKLAA